MAPLAMAILARFTPPEVNLRFIDENVETLPDNLPTDMVAMSVTSLTAKRAYQLSDTFRGRGIKVVLGGIHPTLLPEEAARHADAIVTGAGERVWPLLIDDFSKGKLKSIYLGDSNASLDGMLPDRSIFKGKRHGPLEPIQFGRGCPHHCDFCSVHAVFGTTIRHRPVAEVLDEVAALRRKILFFVDDNLFAYGPASTELLQGLERLKVTWIGQMSVDVAKDPHRVELLARSGCMAALIGFESVEGESLERMSKGVNLRTEYAEAVALLKKNRIMITGSFLFGYDTDTAASVEKAFAFSKSNHFAHAYFNPLLPMPGTALYTRLLEQKRFTIDTWWLSEIFRYGTIPFKTIGDTCASIEGACIKARRAFDTLGSIFQRCFGAPANWRPLKNLIFFWIANIVYRAEYNRKYGKTLFPSDHSEYAKDPTDEVTARFNNR
jgi:radical SAM superfamily enzyme YgiQ (UPF0313 family)